MSSEFTPKILTCLREGYNRQLIAGDVSAGVTVAIVALPLALALGIASGVTPSQGLLTAIVAGFLISALGGSRVQIGGPTGAFIVVVFETVQRFGYSGLATATFLAGLLLIGMGIARLGNVISFIPYPVVTGFTTGIAVIIFSSQVPDFLGLQIHPIPSEFIAKWSAIVSSLSSINPYSFVVALGSLVLLLMGRRWFPRYPVALVAIVISSALVSALSLPVETVGMRFGAINGSLPAPRLPDVSLETIRLLMPSAFTIALLAGIESLLSAVVADGMTGGRHRPNAELVAQGIANIASVCFMGIPATGAIARTATNIKSGAKTPLAGLVHSLTLLLFLLLASPLIRFIPLPALSAILFLVAWNMSELDRFVSLFRAPRSDVLVMLLTFFLTVLVDLTLAVEVGVVLASLLFIKRLRDVNDALTAVKLTPSVEDESGQLVSNMGLDVPQGVEIFELSGPFFFGVADRLKNVLSVVESKPRVFILRMRHVPVIDATGLHALREFVDRLHRSQIRVILTAVRPAVRQQLDRTGLTKTIGAANLVEDLQAGLRSARDE